MTAEPTDTALPVQEVLLAQLVCDGEFVYEEVFAHPWERRDAVVAALLKNYPLTVSPEEVYDVLAPYGGADPDQALVEIVELFESENLDLHLSELSLPIALPERLYVSLTDYADPIGSPEPALAVFASREALCQDLVERVGELVGPDAAAGIEDSAQDLARVLTDRALAPTGGSVSTTDLELDTTGDRPAWVQS